MKQTAPADEQQLCDLIADAAAHGNVLEVRGGGTKADIGQPGRETQAVDVAAFTGVVDYQPSELVLTVRPATPLEEVESLLDSHGQMLAFEPFDHGPIFGRESGSATIGGIVGAGVAGPRRLSAGSARDHLLGFAAVSGRGEAFKGGGKVVKNVTGYDVAKIMAGSWGQLAVFTELTLKVMPRPRTSTTVRLADLSPETAVAAMALAMGSPCAVAAAAHLPGAEPVTLLRLEGFAESVNVRVDHLARLLGDFGKAEPLSDRDAARAWSEVSSGRPVADCETLWRVHVAPSRAAALSEALDRLGVLWLYDWAGSLVWAGGPAVADVRGAAAALGGHAMLLRGSAALRERLPARNPESAGVAALAARVKHSFDPAGVLDPQRFAVA